MSPIAGNAHERCDEQDCGKDQQESHDAPRRDKWIYFRRRERQYHFSPKAVRLLMLNPIASHRRYLEYQRRISLRRRAATNSTPNCK
jgi:hypothetical protein